MSDGGGVKFTWTVSLADRSDGQLLRVCVRHDKPAVKRDGAAQDVPTQNPEPPLLNSYIFNFTNWILILTSAFWETKFYPSCRKNKKILKNKIR